MSMKATVPYSVKLLRSACWDFASPLTSCPRISQPHEALRLLEGMPQSQIITPIPSQFQSNYTPLTYSQRELQTYEFLRLVEKMPQSKIPEHKQITSSIQQSISPVYGQEPWMDELQMMNRNNRKPRNANHGKRPCSRYGRRKRARKYGNPRRGGRK